MDRIEAVAFRNELLGELNSHLLPFWAGRTMDHARGGFLGRLSGQGVPDPGAPKGLVLNARILWTFSAAHAFENKKAYLTLAQRAFDYLLVRFWDAEYGGAFWTVDRDGRPLDTKKKTYGQAFLMYALAEYALTTGNAGALGRAKILFQRLEETAWDSAGEGYLETFERDWTPASDVRLSEKDMNEKKSMNTHLHVLEAYTRLLMAWGHPAVRRRLSGLLRIFEERILARPSLHFRLFFDESWHPKSRAVSFGHDIEGSWLLCEAAEALGDARRISEFQTLAVDMAGAVLREGVDVDGGLMHEAGEGGISDTDKHWWPQAEAVVGFLNAYSISGDEKFWHAARRAWRFIAGCMIDRVHGEWFWRVNRAGVPYGEESKVSEWKCPYHNVRMCLEGIRRLDVLLNRSV